MPHRLDIRRSAAILLVVLASLWSGSASAQSKEPLPELAIGVTAVFLDDQLSVLKEWQKYLTKRLGRNVRFVQRGTYREIIDLLHGDKVDFAWICGYPFVTSGERLRLLAVPVYQGRPEYQAYLIVPVEDQTTSGLSDLKGKVFAFSDPDSNSGFLITRYQLHQDGRTPETHFSRTFFTGAHRKVIEAVAAGLAQGGTVDGYIWDSLARIEPALTAQTRVVDKSRAFGFPPLVASKSVNQTGFARVQEVLLGMSTDPDGRRLLMRMNLDGFIPGEPSLYAEIERMGRVIADVR